jgi:hypothetical protein
MPGNVTNNSSMLVWHFILFGLSLTDLQLFTLQIYYTQTIVLSGALAVTSETSCPLDWSWLRGEPNIDQHLEQFVWYRVYSLPCERAYRTVVQ